MHLSKFVEKSIRVPVTGDGNARFASTPAEQSSELGRIVRQSHRVGYILAGCAILLWAIATAVVHAQLPSSTSPAQAGSTSPDRMPKMIIIVRHAEKPPAEAESPNLSETGWKRANLLPSLFLSSNSHTPRFDQPDVLFATHATKKSNRPVETITPLSQALRLPVDDRYGRQQLSPFVEELKSGKYAGKVVLICWHHGEMQELAQTIGIVNPPAWPETLFDRVWQIRWSEGAPHLTSLPQQLLPGDAVQ
jgi:hypothetical protein